MLPKTPTAPVSWDEYFILIALITSLRSKDPHRKVGAVIVDSANHIVGTGYNGFVVGADESRFPWDKVGDWLDTKHPYVVHAEENAILNSTISELSDCRIYSTLFPCNECAKTIAQKRLRELVYLAEPTDKDYHRASIIIFEAASIPTRRIALPPFEALVSDAVRCSARGGVSED